MGRKIFGTDGVRGQVGAFPLVPDFLVRLAQSIGVQFTRGEHCHRIVIGKDTRLSGYMVESALTSGLVTMGMHVFLVGVLPTPAVAMLTRSLRADLGLVISASHNPFQDNGIKIFDHKGEKLSDHVEHEIEARLESSIPAAQPEDWGYAHRLDDAAGRYVEFVKATFPKYLTLEGWRLVIDCANGANYRVALSVFQELGATVIPMGIHPDGCNINKNCGALETTAMQQAVLQHKAHLGIAFDGDGDRLALADEKGKLIDGDQILGMLAKTWAQLGHLQGNAIVATCMSNLGLEHFLEGHGIGLVRTDVGDRYVSQAMRSHHCNVGGEQSGHILLHDYNTTGDALIAALQILAILVTLEKSASDIFPVFQPVPQVLKNMRVGSKKILTQEDVQAYFRKISNYLGKEGRLVVRPSGTEPMIRIMIEGKEKEMIENLAQDVLNFLSDRSDAA